MAPASEQLEWEARWAKPAAAAAFAYAVLSLAGSVYVSAALEDRPEPGVESEFMRALDAESGVFVVSAVVQALALAVLSVALVYLYGAVKARRPQTPTIALYLSVAGPVVLAAATVLSQLDRIESAEEFFASGQQNDDRAQDLLRDQGPVEVALGLAGALAFGFALVLLSVNAMRAGIMSRFMGVMGVIVGALPVLSSLLPIASGGFVQLFWVVALGFLLLGKWPGGRGPAWETGQAIPWPSAADRRLEAAAGRQPEGEPEPAESAGEEATQSSSPKRKRKRRR